MTAATARLVRPDARYEASVLDAIAEFHGEGRDPGTHQPEPGETFAAFVARLHAMDAPEQAPGWFVPQTTFWLVDGDTFVGHVALRHHLNERLRLIGGHIGYEIRPSKRRQGYGTRALALALDEARQLGLDRVLITTDEENTGSRRIIERNGGILEDAITIPGLDGIKLRYWITL